MGRRVDYARGLPRGLSHPFTHVVYEVDAHTHIYAGLGGEGIEELADGLAEAVLQCGRQRHHVDYQGTDHCPEPHAAEEAERAYRWAVHQLLTRDYYQEYLELQRKIEHYELWGGPVPSLVFQPKPGEKDTWQCLVTHPETGLPHPYDIPASLLELPPPDPKQYHQGQLGYYRKGNVGRSLLPIRAGGIHG